MNLLGIVSPVAVPCAVFLLAPPTFAGVSAGAEVIYLAPGADEILKGPAWQVPPVFRYAASGMGAADGGVPANTAPPSVPPPARGGDGGDSTGGRLQRIQVLLAVLTSPGVDSDQWREKLDELFGFLSSENKTIRRAVFQALTQLGRQSERFRGVF